MATKSAKQLVFDFGRKLLARLDELPNKPVVRRKATSTMRRDPLLEEVARVLLQKAGCGQLAEVVSVWWNPKLRTTAGLACLRSRRVTLNPKLIEVSASEVQITLRHELAHLVAQARAGRRRIAPHGPEWRAACVDLGIPDETRCHSLPFKQRKVARKHFYQCAFCETVMARVRPIRGRVACLKCCKKYNGGRYSEQFRFVEIRPPSSVIAA